MKVLKSNHDRLKQLYKALIALNVPNVSIEGDNVVIRPQSVYFLPVVLQPKIYARRTVAAYVRDTLRFPILTPPIFGPSLCNDPVANRFHRELVGAHGFTKDKECRMLYKSQPLTLMRHTFSVLVDMELVMNIRGEYEVQAQILRKPSVDPHDCVPDIIPTKLIVDIFQCIAEQALNDAINTQSSIH